MLSNVNNNTNLISNDNNDEYFFEINKGRRNHLTTVRLEAIIFDHPHHGYHPQYRQRDNKYAHLRGTTNRVEAWLDVGLARRDLKQKLIRCFDFLDDILADRLRCLDMKDSFMLQWLDERGKELHVFMQNAVSELEKDVISLPSTSISLDHDDYLPVDFRERSFSGNHMAIFAPKTDRCECDMSKNPAIALVDAIETIGWVNAQQTKEGRLLYSWFDTLKNNYNCFSWQVESKHRDRGVFNWCYYLKNEELELVNLGTKIAIIYKSLPPTNISDRIVYSGVDCSPEDNYDALQQLTRAVNAHNENLKKDNTNVYYLGTTSLSH